MKHLLIRWLSVIVPSDFFARRYPVSVKVVIIISQKVVLLKNEREEWELPGGKLEPMETPTSCAAREVKEELNLDIKIGNVAHVWVYTIRNTVDVLMIAFSCQHGYTNVDDIQISHEHKEVALFSVDQLDAINLPKGYAEAIRKATISAS